MDEFLADIEIAVDHLDAAIRRGLRLHMNSQRYKKLITLRDQLNALKCRLEDDQEKHRMAEVAYRSFLER